MNPHVEFFGQIAIKNRLVTPEEVEDCLAIQKKMKGWGIEEPLGEILLDKGYLARDEVEDLLEIQSRMRPDEHQDFLAFRDAIGGKESVLLGELILLNQLVPPQAVEESLRIQKDLAGLGIKKRIGEILIARKLLDPAALVSILRVQAKWLGRGARTPGFRFPVFRLPLATAAAAGIVLLALILFLPDRMGAGRAGWDGDTPRAENDPARGGDAPGVRYSGAGLGLTPPDLPPPGSMVAAGPADHAAAVD
ncbi:MAG: hypothetical protein HY720_19950, partial [Planctomycetes bacterium]|nr:hypothetical protein [Planctomycetota bacterium]